MIGIVSSPRVVAQFLVFAAGSGLAGIPIGTGEAQHKNGPPRPPGVRLVTLPREPDGRPQETFAAVNPRDSRNAIVSFHQAVGDAGSDHHFGVRVTTHVAWSVDGGATWAVGQGTTNEQYLRALDASVMFDGHGHAFLVYLAMDSISKTTRHGNFIQRSEDGGRTWSPPITLAAHPAKQDSTFEHRPYPAADEHAASPYFGNLYVAWDRQLAGGKSEMILTRSTDDGRTWSRPAVVNSHPSRLSFANVAVGPDGAVYLMYAIDRTEEIVLAVSRDGGESFEPLRLVARARPSSKSWPMKDFPRAGAVLPSLAIDPRTPPGRLFIAWADYPYGDSDILLSSSSDRGRTWTAPVRVNDDPRSNGKDQVMQWLAVDPSDGAAYVVFYDRRGDPRNVLPTVTLARSTDGGGTFTNYDWSVSTSDPKRASLGDYIGLAARHGRVYGAWIDNAPTPQKVKPRAAADETAEDLAWPSGPSSVRIGIADFRSDTATAAQGTGRPGSNR